ncbi:hypothetical protein [Nocardia sp. NBC_00511]|uniref:hypothetical protein n=1 Tax=Nocardia sp. NBC_00511 TaxID=2903591 RepID=UPI0030DDFF83
MSEVLAACQIPTAAAVSASDAAITALADALGSHTIARHSSPPPDTHAIDPRTLGHIACATITDHTRILVGSMWG